VEKYGFEIEKMIGSGGSSYWIRGTRLCAIKGSAPRYRRPQAWDIIEVCVDHTDLPLVTGHSLDNALYRLSKVRDLLRKGA